MLTRSKFIIWNAALINRTTSWQHSLVCPWPDDPNQDANRHGAVARYLAEMREILGYIEEEAGLVGPSVSPEARLTTLIDNGKGATLRLAGIHREIDLSPILHALNGQPQSSDDNFPMTNASEEGGHSHV